MSHRRNFIKESAIIFLIIGISYPIGYLIRLLYAKNLSVEEYGLFYAVMAFVGFFDIFRDVGLTEALMRYIPQFRVEKRPDKIKGGIAFVTIVQLTIGLIISLVIFLLSDWLAINFFKNPDAALVTKLIAGVYVINGFLDVITLSLVGLGKPRYKSMVDLMNSILTLVFSFIFFQFLKGVFVPSLAYFIVQICLVLIFLVVLIRNFDFSVKMKLDREIVKVFLDYALKLLIGTGAGMILNQLITNMLTFYAGLAEVGIYSVAYPTALLMFIFAKPIATVLTPFASEHWARNEKQHIGDLLGLVYGYLIVFVMPVMVIFFTYSDLAIELLFGEQFLQYSTGFFGLTLSKAGLSLKVILFGILFSMFSSINGSVNAAIGKPLDVTKAAYISAFVNIIFAVFFIPTFGVVGASFAFTASAFAQFIVALTFVRREVRFVIPYGKMIKSVISGSIFFIVLSILKRLIDLNLYLETILVIGISIMIYGLSIFLLGVVKKKDITALIKILR